VRVLVAELLAATAADAVLVAYHLPKLFAYLVTAWPAEEAAWRQEARGRKTGGGRGGDAAAAVGKQICSCSAG
jgi:hypothetical protein